MIVLPRAGDRRDLELQGLWGWLVERAVAQLPRAREHGREQLVLVVRIVHEVIEIRHEAIEICRARGQLEMAIWLMEMAILVLEMATWQMVRRRLWFASWKR